MNIFVFLTFFYMFIVLSTFTLYLYLYHYKLYSHRETCAENAQKAPSQSFVPAVGLPPLLLWLHENRPAIRVGRFSL